MLHGLNLGYGVFNVGLTVGWLVLLYRRRDPGYRALRNACVLAHLGAQPVFLLLPTAPPRVLDGFVDTIAEVSGFDLEHPLLVRLYNPVAAMPSLHVAFAIVTAGAIADRFDLGIREGCRVCVPAARLPRRRRDREPLRARCRRRCGARVGGAGGR